MKEKTESQFPNIMELREKIIALNNSPEFIKLDNYYKKKSMFNILGISRDETRHSYLLHWLFSSNGSHELEDYSIRKLLEVLVLVKNKLQSYNSEISFPVGIEDDIICGNYKLEDINVVREKPIPADTNYKNSQGKEKAGFLDIYISFKLSSKSHNNSLPVPIHIIIENKVFSNEHTEQTKRYYDYAERELDGEKIYVYLTPMLNRRFESLSATESVCKNFIGINYQYLVDYVIEPCRAICSQAEAKVFLADYLRSLSQFPTNDDTNRKNKDMNSIMALGKEEQALLSKFWESNEDLLLSVLMALKESPQTSSELSEQLDAVVKGVKNTKNTNKYCLNGDETKYSMGKLALRILQLYVQEHNPTLKEINDVFADVLKKSIIFEESSVVSEKEQKSKDKNYKRVRFSSEEPIILSDSKIIYVSTQWAAKNEEDNFFTFKKVAEKLGYEIKDAN